MSYVSTTILAAVASLAAVVATPAKASTTLVFGQNVYASGNAFVSGGSYGSVVAGSLTNANGSGGTNVASYAASSAAQDAAALALSMEYAGLAATGTFATGRYTPGAGTFTGTSNGINVFNIDASSYAGLYALSFAGPGTGAIVNVSGSAFSNYINFDFGSLQASQVVFNFHDAGSLVSNGMSYRGSILAPNATVTLLGGSVAGSVVSNRFASQGSTIGGAGFVGVPTAVPGAVPEPSVWAMLILGFGLVGGALRRRSARARIAFA